MFLLYQRMYKFISIHRYSSGKVLMRTVRGKEKACYYPYQPSTQEDSEEHLTPKRFHSRAASKEDLSPSRYYLTILIKKCNLNWQMRLIKKK